MAKSFSEIRPVDLDDNVFQIMGRDWMLITAEAEGRLNTMTAAWGGFGVMWDSDVVYTVLRPQRYTKQLIDAADTFSLTFLPAGNTKLLGYLGSASGRNEDKIAKSGLTVAREDGTPYFSEGRVVIICKKLFAQELSASGFIDKEIIDSLYSDGDFHTLYVSKIIKILRAE